MQGLAILLQQVINLDTVNANAVHLSQQILQDGRGGRPGGRLNSRGVMALKCSVHLYLWVFLPTTIETIVATSGELKPSRVVTLALCYRIKNNRKWHNSIKGIFIHTDSQSLIHRD
jgi:hypothetical protein